MQKLIVLSFAVLLLLACASKSQNVQLYQDNYQGQVNAKYCFAYKYGDYSLPVNAPLAYQWCLKSAKQGDANSQVLLAEMFYLAELGEQHLEYAYTWYSRAAKQNHPQALFMLSHFYAEGLWVKKDSNIASDYLRQAQSQGINLL